MCFDCFDFFGKKNKHVSDVPERRIVIIGNQGSGKSFAGNSILGKPEAFMTGRSHPLTKTCQKVSSERQGKNLVVIDTPAINYPNKNFFEVGLDLLKFVDMVPASGPHVFVFTIEFGRITDETYESFTCADLYLGHKLGEHCIICFTKVNIPKEEFKQKVEKHKKENKNFADLLEQCKNRYIALKNADKKGEKEFISEILTDVEALSNNGKKGVPKKTFINARNVLKDEKGKVGSSWETQKRRFMTWLEKKES